MALIEHVGILLNHNLTAPRASKPGYKEDCYAFVAYPPSAGADISMLVSEVHPAVAITAIEHNIRKNSEQSKPVVGVPDDYLVVRFSSLYAPALFGTDGIQIANDTSRNVFYAGAQVRVEGFAARKQVSPRGQQENKQQAVRFTTTGLMLVADGQKLNLGNDVSSKFAKFAAALEATRTAPPAPATPPATPTAPVHAQVAVVSNPFQQPAPKLMTANPFA